MIKQNAVSLDGEKITDIFAEIQAEGVIKVGKRRFLKLIKDQKNYGIYIYLYQPF